MNKKIVRLENALLKYHFSHDVNAMIWEMRLNDEIGEMTFIELFCLAK